MDGEDSWGKAKIGTRKFNSSNVDGYHLNPSLESKIRKFSIPCIWASEIQIEVQQKVINWRLSAGKWC